MTADGSYNVYLNQVVVGNALELLKKIPSDSIDMVFTDPPFFGRKSNIIHRSTNKNSSEYKYSGRDIIRGGWDWDNQWSSEDDYLIWTYEWYKEAVRCLRPGGHFLIFFDWLRTYWLWLFGERLNMHTRQPLYFILTNPVPKIRKVDFMNSVGTIFWQTKGTYARDYAVFNWRLGQHRNYVEVPITPTKRSRPRHPTEKHERIVEWLVRYLTRDQEVILDPFAGSGTIPYVAKKLHRRFIAFEVIPYWAEIARTRVDSMQTVTLSEWIPKPSD